MKKETWVDTWDGWYKEMTPKMEKAGSYSPAAQTSSGWAMFEHWVYCPDAPGKCKCNAN